MNTLMLIIIWLIAYPVSCEAVNLMFSVRKKIEKKAVPSLDADYKISKIYFFCYIAVLIWLLSIYYGNTGQ